MTSTLTELTGPELFDAVLRDYMLGQSPPDPLATRISRVQAELSSARLQPTFADHEGTLADLDATINGMTPLEAVAKGRLMDERTRIKKGLDGNQRAVTELGAKLLQLEAIQREVAALSACYQRLDLAALTMSRMQPGVGPVPVFGVYRAGIKTGSPDCALTILTHEDPGQQPVVRVSSDPPLLGHYWLPQGKPEIVTESQRLTNRRGHDGRRLPKRSGGTRRSRLILKAKFDGVLPNDVRTKLPLFEHQFGGQGLYVVAEVPHWQPEIRHSKPKGGDPLLLGIRRLPDGQDICFVLARFDLSMREIALLEFTSNVVTNT